MVIFLFSDNDVVVVQYDIVTGSGYLSSENLKKTLKLVKTDLKVDFLRRLLVESRAGGQRLFDFFKSKIFPDFDCRKSLTTLVKTHTKSEHF